MKSYLDKIFILEGILLAIIGVLFFINYITKKSAIKKHE